MTLVVTTRWEITTVETLSLGPGSLVPVTDNGASKTQLKLNATSTPPVSLSRTLPGPDRGGRDDRPAGLARQPRPDPGHDRQAGAGDQVPNPNADPLVVTPAGTNGYALTFTVPPQGEVLITSTNLLPRSAAGPPLHPRRRPGRDLELDDRAGMNTRGDEHNPAGRGEHARRMLEAWYHAARVGRRQAGPRSGTPCRRTSSASSSRPTG